ARRDKTTSKDCLTDIAESDMVRLARRSGIKHINAASFEARIAMDSFLQTIVSHSLRYCEHERREKVTNLDVMHALKHRDRML
ncbi:histone H4, partial [Colletotrichum somersetense]